MPGADGVRVGGFGSAGGVTGAGRGGVWGAGGVRMVPACYAQSFTHLFCCNMW